MIYRSRHIGGNHLLLFHGEKSVAVDTDDGTFRPDASLEVLIIRSTPLFVRISSRKMKHTSMLKEHMMPNFRNLWKLIPLPNLPEIKRSKISRLLSLTISERLTSILTLSVSNI